MPRVSELASMANTFCHQMSTGQQSSVYDAPAFPPRKKDNTALARLPKCQIDALPAQQRVLAVSERRDAVKGEPRRPAPYRDIVMLHPKAARFVAALQSAEQEDRGQAQRDRDDRHGKIVLVLVLMQGHARAGLIAVD